uniref:Uncharacterized protein n=1 Tax=Mycoplasma anserisalpingitidis TaxID=519450 RepID=A0A8F2DF40_9MOLU|nr:hypothetical protein [Mycoplasma anserisalpingitidis]
MKYDNLLKRPNHTLVGRKQYDIAMDLSQWLRQQEKLKRRTKITKVLTKKIETTIELFIKIYKIDDEYLEKVFIDQPTLEEFKTKLQRKMMQSFVNMWKINEQKNISVEELLKLQS